MKRLIFLFTLFIPIFLSSQPRLNEGVGQACLPLGITFSSQAEIDNFQINYPDCTEIEGDVLIRGGDIINLNGLSGLTAISGELAIGHNPLLINLSGLDTLSIVGDDLDIWSNASLTSLEGLGNLAHIGGRMELWLNHSLISPNGIDQLSSIGGDLEIIMNDSIIDLSGLESLTSVGKDLLIGGNENLISFTGLENLYNVGGNLEIGLIGWVEGNQSLVSITALQNLESIGGDISIWENSTLTSLNGLDNIAASSISNLYIHDNASLSSCEAQSICDFLASPGGTVNIYNNAPGCNNPPEVASAGGMSFECLPFGNYYFCSQLEIDNFPVNYIGCTQLEGNLYISGSDISNLNGLTGLTYIGENLHIGYFNWYHTGNPVLTSLEGLESLDSIGRLILNTNNSLGSLAGLEGLSYVGGGISIHSNATLTSLNGLEGLSSTGGISVSYNDSLYSMTGLENVTSIGSNLSIVNNSALASLTGLENLTTIGGDLRIGRLWYGNPALTNLSGLEGLASIGGDLSIEDNGGLVSLAGLDNVNPASIANLKISFNGSLTSCEAQSICGYLSSPGGVVEIRENAQGCNSPSEIALACGIELPCLPYGNYYFQDQSDIDNFQTNYPGCTHLEGYSEIYSGYGITNLDGLSVLNSIGGSLEIIGNYNLTSLSGLNNVTFVGNNLLIGNLENWGSNPVLTSLDGLESITYVGGSFRIGKNQSLVDLAGLESLTFIGGPLTIRYVESLKNLTGLEKLTFVGEDLWIESNPSLNSINGLEGLEYIGDDVILKSNPQLTELAGLNQLSFVDGNLEIVSNHGLINLLGLNSLSSVKGELRVVNNDNLLSLTGIENIDAGSIRNIEIQSNSLLSDCEIQPICDFLSSPNGSVEIYDNKSGCNSQEEVQEACWIVHINEGQADENQFKFYPNPVTANGKVSGDFASNATVNICIYNTTGLCLKSWEFASQQTGRQEFNLNLNELPPGIYFLRLQVGNEVMTKKVIKLK